MIEKLQHVVPNTKFRLESYLPAVNTDPLAVPKTDMTTPSGIKKLAGPRTLLAQSLRIIYLTKFWEVLLDLGVTIIPITYHCYCAGRYNFLWSENSQVWHVYQNIANCCQGNGYDDSQREIPIFGNRTAIKLNERYINQSYQPVWIL